jgi:hypothetical protein
MKPLVSWVLASAASALSSIFWDTFTAEDMISLLVAWTVGRKLDSNGNQPETAEAPNTPPVMCLYCLTALFIYYYHVLIYIIIFYLTKFYS